MSIFSETMIQVISEYRTLLRRHLTQVERMIKLQKLGLRDENLYENEVTLYNVGQAIVRDIKINMTMENPTYYSYSGVQQFAEHLEGYLLNYYLENNQVVHRAQKASRAVLSAVQWMGLPKERLDDSILKRLCDCSKTVVSFGSEEQCDLLMQAFSRQKSTNPSFYTRVIALVLNP